MTRLITRLRELARMVQEDKTLSEIFSERKFDALSDLNAQGHPGVQAFQAAFERMLRIYGLRNGRGYGSGGGFGAPTWNMCPVLPLEVIASYVEQGVGRLEDLEKQARRDRQNAVKRVRRMLARTPEKLEQFNRGLRNATTRVRTLEDHNDWMEQCTIGTLREAIFEVGKGLTQKGLVDQPDDVFHFSLAELKAIARVEHPEDQRVGVRERFEEKARRARMRPPRRLGKVSEEKDSAGSDASEDVGRSGNVIRGASASGGHIGPARVLLPGDERPKIHPGDILVAQNVGPDWTPVFPILGGLVLDEGVLFQHAALVAREYRIPAVLQTRDATETIAEGQVIGVDGDQGIVELEV